MAAVGASHSGRRIIGYILRPGGRCGREQRYRVGESHARSTIPDSLVARIRRYHRDGIGWRRIWRMLHASGVAIGRSSVRRIVFFEVRTQIPQTVEVQNGGG